MYEDKEDTIMSYVDEVIAKVVEQNPSEPEFHQAVKVRIPTDRLRSQCIQH